MDCDVGIIGFINFYNNALPPPITKRYVLKKTYSIVQILQYLYSINKKNYFCQL